MDPRVDPSTGGRPGPDPGRVAAAASSPDLHAAELNALYTGSPIGLALVDRDLRFVRVNARMAAINGYSVEEHLGRTIEEILPGLPDVVEGHRRVLRTGRPVVNIDIAGETVAEPGVERHWLVNWIPVVDDEGAVLGVESVVLDVTEGRRAEAARRRKARQHKALAEFGSLALSGASLDTLLARASRVAARALGVELTKILELDADGGSLLLRAGVGWDEGIAGSARVPADAASQAGYTLLSEAPVVVEDLAAETRFTGPPLLTDHGVVSGMSVVIEGADGPWGVFGVHTRRRHTFSKPDIDFLRTLAVIVGGVIEREAGHAALAAQARELESRVAARTADLQDVVRQLDAFARSVSHDLKAPLRSLMGFSEALIEDCGDELGDVGRDYATRISDSAAHMNRLIEDLLEHARLGRHELPLGRVELDRLLDEVRGELEDEIAAAGAEVRVERPLPAVRAHHGSLVRAVYNVVENALKFVPSGRTPVVEVRAGPAGGGCVRLEVADNGIGIDEEHRHRIFGVFERLHGRESYPGTGIGLAIVATVMARTGGSVGIEDREGGGSVFWMKLPAAREAPA